MLTVRRLIAALIVLALAAGAVWIVTPPRDIGWERLQSGVRVRAPDGGGPFPVVFLLHGCGGERDYLDQYADAVVDAGAAAVLLDSFEPRGIGRARAIMSVCTGWRLRGGARTADLVLALENLDDPRLDLGRVSLAGWSHGAWTIAELLTEAPAERGVRSAFLVYPYCRFPARWPGRQAPEGVRILAVIPDDDVIGDAPACRNALARTGAEIVRIPDTTHDFEDSYPLNFPYRHNAEAFAENRARLAAFVRETLDVPGAEAPLAPAGADR